VKTKIRRQLLNMVYDTPWESFARTAYMYFLQRNNFYTDRQTVAVMEKMLSNKSNCIDVGCYRGEILKHMVRLCPYGRLFAFEPTPYHYGYLAKKFPSVNLFPVALDCEPGNRMFQFDQNYPARSGLMRQIDSGSQIEEFAVQVDSLDNIIPPDCKIDFVKIDVEGAEFGVFSGGRELFKRNRPVVVFEHDADAAGMFQHTSEDLYNLICDKIGLSLSTMGKWLQKLPPLDQNTFIDCIRKGRISNFIAY